MKICYNVSAMIANNALTRNDDRLAKSLQRLSSGLKVSEAKDNPSGMAMGKRMNAQIAGISVATQNSSDAISVIETADGALAEVQEILQRMNELAVKSNTATVTDSDRANLNEEIIQLKQEISRISKDTEFNGQKLLDGSFDLRGYTNKDDIRTGYISDTVIPGKYPINSFEVTYDADGNIGSVLFAAGTATGDQINLPADVRIGNINKGIISLISPSQPDFQIDLKCPSANTPGSTVSYNGLEVEVAGFGAMTMQIGANEGQTLDIRIPTVSLENLGMQDADLSNKDAANKAIRDISNAISYISSTRSTLGAYQNRLEHNVNSLDVTSENMTAAYSRIMDVDMAEEMTEYTTRQVISQSAMSMLAQANESPSQVLQLLQ